MISFRFISTLTLLYNGAHTTDLLLSTNNAAITTSTTTTKVIIDTSDLTFNTYDDRDINIPSYERYALHDFYRATNGSDWVYHTEEGQWNFTDPDVNPCLPSDPWQGLNCTTSNGTMYISEIQLPLMHLVGTIPESIGTVINLLRFNHIISHHLMHHSMYRQLHTNDHTEPQCKQAVWNYTWQYLPATKS